MEPNPSTFGGELGSQLDDREAEFVRLLLRDGRLAYSCIRTFVRNQSDAEDVFQEVKLTAWQRFDQFEHGTRFDRWLRQIAMHTLQNLMRRRSLTLVGDSESLFDRVGNNGAWLDRLDERAVALESCLASLRSNDRGMINSRYHEGLSVREVAHRYKRSADATYKALSRIRRVLFDCVNRKMEALERQ